jgi:hypothetical protein
MKIALGTVQFGMHYGIGNQTGQVDQENTTNILNYAQSAGIDTIDTAICYGESEQFLGEANMKGWKIITKLPKVPSACPDISDWVNEQVKDSLSRLKVPNLSGLLLHCPDQLLNSKGKSLWYSLQELKKSGIVEKIGFSIYDPSELDSLWPIFKPDLVQSPYNILDRRLATSGWMKRLSEAGVEIHIRSVFLQGLLLMSEKKRPNNFNRWSKVWKVWYEWLQDNNLTPLQGSLAFVQSDPRISRIIVGIDTLSQLEEILLAKSTWVTNFPEELSILDRDLLEPSRWDINKG